MDTNKNVNSISIPLDDELYEKSHKTTKDLIESIDSITKNVLTEGNAKSKNDHTNDVQSQTLLMKTIPYSFLSLKETQRTLCQNVGLYLQSNISQKRKEVESQSLLLQNLIYEKSHLEREIRENERGFENVYLLKMAKDELGITASEEKAGVEKDTASTTVTGAADIGDSTTDADTLGNNDSNDHTLNDTNMKDEQEEEEDEAEEDDEDKIMKQNDAIINSYLKQPSSTTYSYRDPKNHQYTIAKLLKETSQRGILQNELTKASKRKLAFMSELKEQNEFLKGIPNQIKLLENWSMPLQDYFKKHHEEQMKLIKKQKMEMDDDDDYDENENGPTETSDGVGVLIGSERRNLLSHAKDLPGPLYTLFVQFQSFLDTHSTIATSADIYAKTISNDIDTGTMDDLMMNDIYDWKLHVIDTNSNNSSSEESKEDQSKMHSIIKELTKSAEKAIQLWIPIPNITFIPPKSSKNKNNKKQDYVNIQFTYFPKLNIVTAHVVCVKGADKHVVVSNLDKVSWYSNGKSAEDNVLRPLLLHNLYDNDDGMDLPQGCALGIDFSLDDDKMKEENGITNSEGEEEEDVIHKNGDDEIMDYDAEDMDDNKDHQNKNKKASMSKAIFENICEKLINGESNTCYRPYNWCQYLAGLHFPRNSKTEYDAMIYRMDPTIKLTIMKLRRRIRSHATLSAMMKLFAKKDFPNPITVHPSMKGLLGEDECNYKCRTKLDRWTEDTNNPRKSIRNLNTFYNVILTCKSKTLNACVEIDPRYPAVPPIWSLQPQNNDVSMGNEHAPLYDNTLGELEVTVNTLKCLSKFLNGEIEDSFDWILVHQLRVIMIGWDRYQASLESCKKNDDSKSTTQRQRRGRDRRPIDSIAFEMFKHGL